MLQGARWFTVPTTSRWDYQAMSRWVRLPDPSNPGKIDLAATMQDWGARGINELHVEAGARLMGPLIAAGLVDELLVHLGPSCSGAMLARCSPCQSRQTRRGHAV